MNDNVWLCMIIHDGVFYLRLCMSMYDYVDTYDYVWLCMTISMYDYDYERSDKWNPYVRLCMTV